MSESTALTKHFIDKAKAVTDVFANQINSEPMDAITAFIWMDYTANKLKAIANELWERTEENVD
ncbi:hypothetical protein [Cryptobacterium curtum]